MARGGNRPGAGRKAGTPNKASAERQKAVEDSGMTPLDFLLKVMRDGEEDKDARRDAAKAAAPYVHPRLSAIEMNANVSLSHEDALEQLKRP